MDEKTITDTLAKLTPGGILAFAIRCARRVFPLTQVLPDADRETVDKAIRYAEVMLTGAIPTGVECLFECANLAKAADKAGKIALGNAINAATYTGMLAEAMVGLPPGVAAQMATGAYMHAYRAMVAANLSPEPLELAVERDLHRLTALYVAPRQGVDPSESGPLGSLWLGRPPEWKPFLKGASNPEEYEYPRFSVSIEPGNAPPELISEFYRALDALYRSYGGSGLKITGQREFQSSGQKEALP